MNEPARPVVLLAVADFSLRRELGRAVIQAGYAVVIRRSRQGALEYAGRHRPALVLLDLHEAGEEGWEILRGLRARGGGPRVVVVGPPGDSERRERALGLGAGDYLSMPADRERLSFVLAAQVPAPGD